MTLSRLPDPVPDEWFADTLLVLVQVQPHREWNVYGNFWPDRPCQVFPHRWRVLRKTFDAGRDHRWIREIRRCQRCGAQVHQFWQLSPPRRGRL